MRKRRRVIIVAPTRAVCVNLRALLSAERFETRLMSERGQEVIDLVRRGKGFGIVAVTGSGKSASIKDIAAEEFGEARYLAYDIVTREHEATARTWRSNVIVITPGIALIWAKNKIIKKDDIIIFDEIHQTSDHLELTMALILRLGCRVMWMSATVDPEFYRDYLLSDQVIVFDKIEESKKTAVQIIHPSEEGFIFSRDGFICDKEGFLYKKIKEVIREKKGMAMFLPTRRETEEYAEAIKELFPGEINVEFYNGGEPADKLEPYLNKGIANKNRPFVIFMTNAGQSGLNIEGLSVIVVRDQCYTEKKIGRTVVRIKTFLGANDILQMIGRINGRVSGGEAFIIAERNIDFDKLRPEKVEFALGNDLSVLAMVCGKLGIKPKELKLPQPVDGEEYAKVIKDLIRRNIFKSDGINLTDYGRKVERLPCSAKWAELIVNSSPGTLNAVIVCSASSGLFRIVKPEADLEYGLAEFVVPGSDHLTVYNIVAHAINNFAETADDKGYTEYQFREKEFYEWAEGKGISAKEIEEIALALKSILHNLGIPIPEKLAKVDEKMRHEFVELLARVRSLEIVQN